MAPDPVRRRQLSMVHIARQDLALDDGTYRALLARIAGHDSAAKCDAAQLDRIIDEFRRLGWQPTGKARPAQRQRHDSPLAGKIRALWLSLHHLGALGDASEAALAAFIHRTVGVEALQWLTPADADRVINALKGWCERVGFVQPDAARVKRINEGRRGVGLPAIGAGVAAKFALIERQWQVLIELGALRHTAARLDTLLMRDYGVSAVILLAPGNADRCIERLGAWIRKVKTDAAVVPRETSVE